jgi:hypothetical protein
MPATALKPPPPHAPKRLRTTGDLRTLQRLMTHALIRPLTAGDRLQPRWIDGRATAEIAAEFIKPNGRLTSFERLELYNRMYWFRLFDCVYDDNPGLRALLGEKQFAALVQAFLAKNPSRSFSLRDLCARLEDFIREEPKWTAPKTALAVELAAFAWTQTVAFDAEQRPVLTAADLAQMPPGRLRLGLQPYVSLLALNHAVDDYVVAVKKQDALREAVSNASDAGRQSISRTEKTLRPRRARLWLAVHRVDNSVYFKRLEPAAFKILVAIRDGSTLSRAVAMAGPRVTPEQVQRWFTNWMSLGWFCHR